MLGRQNKLIVSREVFTTLILELFLVNIIKHHRLPAALRRSSLGQMTDYIPLTLKLFKDRCPLIYIHFLLWPVER